MKLHIVDLLITAAYLILVAIIGFWVKNRATRGVDSYFLAERNVPWWMLGFSGCSSYIDIGGTMAMIAALYYLGLKSVWMVNIYWGWFTICFFMAFQGKWIRRSGVMTFAEWNKTRFGDNKDAEKARLAAALFVFVLMLFNLMYISVGIGKFVVEFIPLPRWGSTLIIFSVVGVYITLAGFYGIILTDMIQTVLIAIGAIILTVMFFQSDMITAFVAQQPPEWSSINITWNLWDGYLKTAPESYHHFFAFGPVLIAGFSWLIFRVLAGPNVWDFQFFLTARSSRDAAMAGGMWTVGYTLRWFLGCALMALGIYYLGTSAGFDAEKIMPRVILNLPMGVQGLFVAVLLAALMSTLDAMINVTSNVILNDFIRRYFLGKITEKTAVRIGQAASLVVLFIAYIYSLSFGYVISAWETMIFVIVTMILAPATMRWHWWRFSAKAFVWSMAVTAFFIIFQKTFFSYWSAPLTLAVDTLTSVVITVIFGHIFKPTDKEILIDFYTRIRPFGFWKPIRKEAIKRGLIPADDKTPSIDATNGLLTMIFQFALALVPFYLFLKKWNQFYIWIVITVVMGIILYFTWYKNLPTKDEI